MTKKKTQPFTGAWLNFSMTDAVPVTSLLAGDSEAAKKARRQMIDEPEERAQKGLLDLIAKERKQAGEFRSLTAAKKDSSSKAIQTETLNQLAHWRFQQEFVEKSPQPNQWPEILAAIKIPRDADAESPELYQLQNDFRDIPLQLRCRVDTYLFTRVRMGRIEFMDLHCRHPTNEGHQLLSDCLECLMEYSKRTRSKPGPKNSVEPYLTALAVQILASTAITNERQAMTIAAKLLQYAGIPRVAKGKSQIYNLIKKHKAELDSALKAKKQ